MYQVTVKIQFYDFSQIFILSTNYNNIQDLQDKFPCYFRDHIFPKYYVKITINPLVTLNKIHGNQYAFFPFYWKKL